MTFSKSSYALLFALVSLPGLTGTTRAQAPGSAPAGATAPAPTGAVDASLQKEGRDLPPVVITPGRKATSLMGVPALVHLLDRQRILQERQVRSMVDALEELPGVMVQKTTHGHGSPYIRGFTGYHTLLLIDGIRLNNSVFRAGPNQYWNTVDPWSFDRMELVKGPCSVLYGSDAVGGTLQALTRELRDFGPGLGWERSLHLRWSSGDHSYLARAEVMGSLDERLRFWVGASAKDFGNLRCGGGVDEMKHTGYDEWDGDLKLAYDLTDDSELVFFHQQVNQDDVWRVHKTVYGKSWRGTSVGSELKRSLDQTRRLTYLQYHDRQLGTSPIRNFKASISWHEQDEERNRIRLSSGQVRHDIQGFDVGTLGIWAQAETESDLGTWSYGLEFYRDEVQSKKREYRDGVFNGWSIQGPVGDNADYTLLAVFVQDEFDLGDELAASVGCRYTWVEADADRVEDPNTGNPISLDDRFDAFVGSLKLTWRPDEEDRWALFGGVSQGFRAPNLSDLSRLDSARSNEIETPTPGLDPEYYTSYELGGRLDMGDLKGQAAYFYTDIRDMIVRTPTGNVIAGDAEVTKRNAGDGYIHGIELAGSWVFHENWRCFGNFTWVYGKASTYPTSAPVKKDEPLDRLMPVTANFGLRWEDRERRVWAEFAATVAGKAKKLSTRDEGDTQRIPPGGTPAYEVFHLRGGWEFREGWTLDLALENVLNRAYRIHGSGQNEVGFNFILGLGVVF